jgi:predicted NAD/FAD-binding protein
MLSVWGSPGWRTVVGGSRVYVEAIAARLDDVRCSTPVALVERDARGVTIVDGAGRESRFDGVVLAAHPDQALRMLGDPSADEQRLLGAFAYARNETVLHTDASLLPRARSARASWNYLLDACATTASEVQVTYHLNRLQALNEEEQYCVTLGAGGRIAPAREVARMVYEHPAYTVETRAAQRELPRLSGERRTAFCGAYHGWGFHEDGCLSGARAAAALGVAW